MNRQFTLVLAVMVGGLLMMRSELFALDAGTAFAGLLLLLLCGGPAVLWVWRGMPHLPIFETYALMHLVYYWHPAGKPNGTVLGLEAEQRVTFLGVVALYLAAGAAVYYYVLRSASGPARGWRFWSNEIPAMRGTRLPWLLLGLWLAYNTTFQYGTIWALVPGTAMPLVRALCGAAGLLGIFVLGHRAGAGELSRFQAAAFIAATLAGTLVSFASGYLAVGTVFAGNAFFAYMVGARRLPVMALTLFVLFLSFLNYGKGEMRARYWLMGESADNIVELYAYWFKSSWEQLSTPTDRRGDSMSAFERANLTDVCARVITQSPHPLPFLNGKTYIESLQLFVPRLIWPDRPSLHIIMNEVGLRYGIHVDRESTEVTMISLGQIAEAWANGGWFVVGLVGGFFGFFFSMGARLAYQRGFATVGFLFGMTFVGFAVNLEHLAGTLLMTFYQTAAGSLALLYWFSQRSSSPTRKLPSASEGQTVAPVS